MELMIIVWIVSVLSSLGSFLDVVCWILAIAATIVTVAYKSGSTSYMIAASEYKDGEQLLDVELTTPDGKVYPAGTVVKLNVYDKYCFINGEAERVPRGVVVNALAASRSIPKAKVSRASGALNWLAVVSVVTAVLIPSDNTMKYMAGAYLVQSAYESDLMVEATPLAKRAVLNQLRAWSEDAPDLMNLLPKENQDVPTNQP
jgi:hypothetical protein